MHGNSGHGDISICFAPILYTSPCSSLLEGTPLHNPCFVLRMSICKTWTDWVAISVPSPAAKSDCIYSFIYSLFWQILHGVPLISRLPPSSVYVFRRLLTCCVLSVPWLDVLFLVFLKLQSTLLSNLSQSFLREVQPPPRPVDKD